MLASESIYTHLNSSACPSIKFRVGSEFLHNPIDSDEMQILQNNILLDSQVKEIINSQKPDGWFGTRFHGYDSFESGIRLLIEKGVSLSHPSIISAMDALEIDTERISQGLGSFGRYFDEKRLGGARLIQAWLLALGGRCDHPIVNEQVKVAIEGMQSVLMVNCIEDMAETWRNHWVFKEGLNWPGIYHLRLLAYTQSWRTPNNLEMTVNAIKRMVQLSPIVYTHVRKGSQLIAPASFAMLDLNTDLHTLDDCGWMMWFHRTELLARMGILQRIDLLKQQLVDLYDMLIDNQGMFTLPLKHDYFKKWGAYTGLMLESDWKIPIRRINDLTFRSCLILQKCQL